MSDIAQPHKKHKPLRHKKQSQTASAKSELIFKTKAQAPLIKIF